MPIVEIESLRNAEERERALEGGAILLFRDPPFAIPEADRAFLLAQRQSGGRFHKNIAYRPARDRVTGFAGGRQDRERLRRVLADYSRASLDTLGRVLPDYAPSWRVDYASFRPIEEEGRELPPKARKDRIHVDAFPTRPTNGDRILRFFSNIHPDKAREWMSGGTFDRLAGRYAVDSGLLAEARRARPSLSSRLLRAAGARRDLPSAYDRFMLRFHDYLKESAELHASSEREFLRFAPGATWIVLTDMVSHAVLSGRFALEQTVILARGSLRAPDLAPIAILERLAGERLA